MANRSLADEPMIGVQRIAERHKCRLGRVSAMVNELERRGEIQPQRTGTRRCFLSFRDAERVDAHLSQ